MMISSALEQQPKPYPNGLPMVLIAEDSRSDQCLLREAFNSAGCEAHLQVVSNGAALLDYLGDAVGPNRSRATPNLIVLDLNMPIVDGLTALRTIKADPTLRSIPVVVFTASRDQADINNAYNAGANVYMTKPDSFVGWVSVVETIHEFFFGASAQPVTVC
jgi:CheY-like chemotaxis protein